MDFNNKIDQNMRIKNRNFVISGSKIHAIYYAHNEGVI